MVLPDFERRPRPLCGFRGSSYGKGYLRRAGKATTVGISIFGAALEKALNCSEAPLRASCRAAL